MAKIDVNPELCKSCGFCIAACPQKIIRVGEVVNAKGTSMSNSLTLRSAPVAGCAPSCVRRRPSRSINKGLKEGKTWRKNS